MKPLYPLLILLVFVIISSQAQDVQLSQFYMSPLTLNPALTGMFDGNYRVTGNYREYEYSQQGLGATFDGSADFSLQSFNNNRLGIGINYMDDERGIYAPTNNGKHASISLAYLLSLTKNGNYCIAAGVQGSYSTAEGQNTIFLPPVSYSSVSGSKDYYDYSTGALFYHIKNKRSYQYIGASAFHLNQPDFWPVNVPAQEVLSAFLPVKYVLNAGADFKISSSFDIVPYLLRLTQEGQSQYYVGTFIRYLWHPGVNNNSVYFGAFNVMSEQGDEAWVLAAKLELSDITIGFSYDFDILYSSDVLFTLTNFSGPYTAEFSIQYSGAFSKSSKDFLCPKF